MAGTLLGDLLLRFDLLLLIFARMLGLFTTAPVWSNRMVPVQLRAAISFGTAVVLFPLLEPPELPATLVGLIPMVLRELLVGMTIGFVASLIFSAVQFAGQLLDVGMGLSMINVLDPMSNTQMPVMGNFLYILSLLIFFGVNGHHMLIEAVVDSYRLLPIGAAVLSTEASGQLVLIAGTMFVIALKIAAPVLAAIFVTTVTLGILNRVVPQMNVFIIGLPVQFGVGIFMLAVVMPLYLAFLRLVFDMLFAEIAGVLQLLEG